MHTILITDTHFGVKQNSVVWLEAQLDFIYKQLIPHIKKLKKVRIVHLGDVFESRSSIGTMVGQRTCEAFEQIANMKEVQEFFIIAGNHDFYSPNTDEICTLELLFGKSNKIKLIIRELYINGDQMYVPWYVWLQQYDKLQGIIDREHIKHVFTHADIVTKPIDLKNCTIYSGHMHTPKLAPPLMNLGATYSLDFSDSNHNRGMYVIEDKTDKLYFYANKYSIKFWRLRGNEILEPPKEIDKKDYIEIYIPSDQINTEPYSSAISKLMKQYKNIWLVPILDAKSSSIKTVDLKDYDIESIAKVFVPNRLLNKFEKILKK